MPISLVGSGDVYKRQVDRCGTCRTRHRSTGVVLQRRRFGGRYHWRRRTNRGSDVAVTTSSTIQEIAQKRRCRSEQCFRRWVRRRDNGRPLSRALRQCDHALGASGHDGLEQQQPAWTTKRWRGPSDAGDVCNAAATLCLRYWPNCRFGIGKAGCVTNAAGLSFFAFSMKFGLAKG